MSRSLDTAAARPRTHVISSAAASANVPALISRPPVGGTAMSSSPPPTNPRTWAVCCSVWSTPTPTR
ncbi:MAG: hypothetical protein KY442_13640, partial [Proteobacteria bacterium]|nr:hypothetical protein [Pseudomonadota bacterium]